MKIQYKNYTGIILISFRVYVPEKLTAKNEVKKMA